MQTLTISLSLRKGEADGATQLQILNTADLVRVCIHVIIKLSVARHCVAQCGEKLAWSFEDFGNRISQALVIAWLMSINTWRNRRHDVLRTTMFSKEDFDACARGLRGFDENEFVSVRQDHRTWPNAVTLIATELRFTTPSPREPQTADCLAAHQA